MQGFDQNENVGKRRGPDSRNIRHSGTLLNIGDGRPFSLSRIVRARRGKSTIRVASYSIAEKGEVFIVDLCELPQLDEIHTPFAELAF